MYGRATDTATQYVASGGCGGYRAQQALATATGRSISFEGMLKKVQKYLQKVLLYNVYLLSGNLSELRTSDPWFELGTSTSRVRFLPRATLDLQK